MKTQKIVNDVSDENTFIPVKVGTYVPIGGFNFQVIEANKSEIRLRVHSVSKAGRKLGYVVTEKKDNPLELKEEAKLSLSGFNPNEGNI